MQKKQLKAAKKFTEKLLKKCEKLAQEYGLSIDVQIYITSPDSNKEIKCKLGTEVKVTPTYNEEFDRDDELDISPVGNLILGYIAGKEFKGKQSELTTTAITKGLDMEKETVKATLARLVELGELTKSGSRYRIAIKFDKDAE